MNATIYSHKSVIGTAQLQVSDESMGGVFGLFIPNDNYYKDIQKYIWEFWAANKPDYQKWNSLRINVQLDNGLFLFPYGGYTFGDSPDFPDEPKRIDIAGVDISILRFSKDILLEPWFTVDIEQKLYFEDELAREITPIKSFFSLLSFDKMDNHILVGAEISTFAKYEPNDDVLFAVKRKGENSMLASVHLTWINRKNEQSSDFPTTHFYSDFNDFVERRMKPDNEDWNFVN
ncbi:hypothetical protein [Pedobacter frigiditerrae]|uniref:hypothetical protein n=1 Tax=Pedobacter frigiditerrae TaxID=2530452 RepID=UPI00292D8A38|nr:hypothetical protein [Pedobacter frigiditerrae]